MFLPSYLCINHPTKLVHTALPIPGTAKWSQCVPVKGGEKPGLQVRKEKLEVHFPPCHIGLETEGWREKVVSGGSAHFPSSA